MKPQVELKQGQLADNVDRTWAALVDPSGAVVPSMMVRGSELVRYTERGELEPYGSVSLTDYLSRTIEFVKLIENDEEDEPAKKLCDPPRTIAEVLINRDSVEYVDAPRVDQVVDTPVLGSSGAVIDTPGYHPDDRLLYIPADALAGVEAGSVETVFDIKEAHDFLMDELLGDFGFEDEASKANALALLLTPFVREYIGDSPTPLFLIVAPEVGTGKSLLAQAALLPGCGLVPLSAETKNEEEQRKRITASLLSGVRAVVLDNISGSVTSNVLAGAITSGVWTDRMLGESKQLVLPIRNVWVATGNNLDLADDAMRRSVPIVLDPGDVRPSDRSKAQFRHQDLLGWAKTNRAGLVKAALTLIRHWTEGEAFLNGHFFQRVDERRSSDRTLGSFERWGEVVGGILAAVDVHCFLANREQVGGFNNERKETADFLAAWHELKLEPVTSRGLLDHCKIASGGKLYDVLPEVLQHDRLDARGLGTWLRGKKEARYDGLRVVADRQHRGAVLWSVE
jgi:hypothetical protein